MMAKLSKKQLKKEIKYLKHDIGKLMEINNTLLNDVAVAERAIQHWVDRASAGIKCADEWREKAEKQVRFGA